MNFLPNKLCKINLLSIIFNQNLNNVLEKHSPKIIIPSRNTFILKRKYPVRLRKAGLEDIVPKLKGKDYVYDLVENTELREQEKIPVILREYVEGIGQKGDCVLMKKYQAYNKLLVSGLADYATPETIEAAKKRKESQQTRDYSTLSAPLTVKYLESRLIAVVMNKDVEWTIEPWHIRVAFRKAGVHVPTNSIQLPEKPIKGPNLAWECKYFCVTVTINNKEKATIRCRLHHWSTNPGERLPYVESPWALPQEAIFPDDVQKIKELPEIKFKKNNV